MSDGIFSFSIMPSLVEVKHSSYGTRIEKKTVFCSSSPLKTHCVNLTRFDPSESSKRVSIHESSKFSKLLHFKTISWMNEIIIEVNR